MGRLISASIDLNKINKSRIIDGKNGQKYYNILISVNDEKDKYGQDVSISHNQTKEERERGDKKVFLGNGKTIWDSVGVQSGTYQNNSESDPANVKPGELPF